jgi:hypothetical protein
MKSKGESFTNIRSNAGYISGCDSRYENAREVISTGYGTQAQKNL